jgi:hypothetical protein
MHDQVMTEPQVASEVIVFIAISQSLLEKS